MKRLFRILEVGCACCALVLLAISKVSGADCYAKEISFVAMFLVITGAAVWGIR